MMEDKETVENSNSEPSQEISKKATENSSNEPIQNVVNTMSHPSVRFQVGSKVGQFTILRLISTEGLCQTYLAKHSVTNKEAVIKLLPKDLNKDDGFLKRFDTVSQKIQHLIHPNILNERRVEVRGVDHYIIEDFIHNKVGRANTLEEELTSGRKLTQNQIKSMILQICGALESAYKYKDLKCVHKDFKPSHILLDTDNQPRIAHFSLVPLVGSQNFLEYLHSSVRQISKEDLQAIHEGLDDDLQNDLISMSGVTNMDNTSSMLLLSQDSNEVLDVGKAKFVGSEYLKKIVAAKPEDNSEIMLKVKNTIAAFDSIEHMSPEQKSTGKVTAQSNIYTLGYILYRMLTGKKMAGSWGLPSSFGCHKDWDPIVLKCLKRDVAYRYQSIHDVIRDIEQVGERKQPIKVASVILGTIIAPVIALTAYNCVSTPEHFDFDELAVNARAERLKEDSTAIAIATKKKVDHPQVVKRDRVLRADINMLPSGGYLVIIKDKEIIKEFPCFPAEGLMLNMKKGDYEIQAGKNGYQNYNKTISLSDMHTRIQVDLIPEDEASQPESLAVTTDFPEFGKGWKINTPNIEFVPIAPGNFNMGAPMLNLTGTTNESPVHRVKLTHPFWMSKFEVKQKIFKLITNKSPSFHHLVGREAPVENVTWRDAVLFCERLNNHQKGRNKIPEGYEYRLPTEAEWEYSCRAGSKTKYSFKKPIEIYKYTWFDINSNDKVHVTGQKAPNKWGLYDMHGNVWEWCLDAAYDYTSKSQVDPVNTSGSKRIIRGGSFNAQRRFVTSSSRNAVMEDYKENCLGFRIVLAPIIKLNN